MQQITYFAHGSNMCSWLVSARLSFGFVASGGGELDGGLGAGVGAPGGVGRQGIIVIICTPGT